MGLQGHFFVREAQQSATAHRKTNAAQFAPTGCPRMQFTQNDHAQIRVPGGNQNLASHATCLRIKEKKKIGACGVQGSFDNSESIPATLGFEENLPGKTKQTPTSRRDPKIFEREAGQRTDEAAFDGGKIETNASTRAAAARDPARQGVGSHRVPNEEACQSDADEEGGTHQNAADCCNQVDLLPSKSKKIKVSSLAFISSQKASESPHFEAE